MAPIRKKAKGTSSDSDQQSRGKQPSPSWGDERQLLNNELTTETGVSNSQMESPDGVPDTYI